MVDLVKAREKARKEKEEKAKREPAPTETGVARAESAGSAESAKAPSAPSAPLPPPEAEGPELNFDDADTLELEPAEPAVSRQPPAVSEASLSPAAGDSPRVPRSEPSAPPAPPAPAAPPAPPAEDDGGGDDDAPAPEEATAGRYLVFLAGPEIYGVAIETIDEIIPIQPVTMVPTAPVVVAGIMSLRGRIVTVVDARRRLGHEPREFTPESRVIVIRHGGELFGLQVDSVRQVMSVPEESVEPITSVMAGHAEPCLRGVHHHAPEEGKGRSEMVILVDLGKFLEISARTGLTDPIRGEAA